MGAAQLGGRAGCGWEEPACHGVVRGGSLQPSPTGLQRPRAFHHFSCLIKPHAVFAGCRRDSTMDTLRVDVDAVGAVPLTAAAAFVCFRLCPGRCGPAAAPQLRPLWPVACCPVLAAAGRSNACAVMHLTHPASASHSLQAKGCIKVLNNGAGIPVEIHQKEGIYVSEGRAALC